MGTGENAARIGFHYFASNCGFAASAAFGWVTRWP
jgi:hypothetical protein